MKKRNKRILALLMAFALILQYSFSASFISVYAEGEDGQVEVTQTESSASESKAASEPAPAPAAEKPAPAPAAQETKAADPAPAEPAGSDDSSGQEEASSSDSASDDAASAEAAAEDGESSDAVVAEDPAADPEAEAVEEEEEEEVKYPAKTFTGSAGGVSVTVNAPEGALPEGTTMKVSGVSESAVIGKVQNAVDGEVSQVKAVDISFRCDGKEIEPERAVSVHMNASGIDTDGSGEVVHIADNGSTNTVGASVSDSGSTSFSAKDFSIYAIVITSAPGTRDYERDLDGENRWAIKIRYEDEDGRALPGKTGQVTLTDGDSVTIESIIGDYTTIEVNDEVYTFENAYFYFDGHYSGRKVYITSFISYNQLNAYGDHLSYSGTLHNTDGSVETNTWIYNNTGVLHLVYTKQDKVMHKVTYHSNIPDGSDEVVSNNWPEGSRIVALSYAQAFGEEPVGYSFLGWAETPDAAAPQYAAGATVTSRLTGDKELYAVWEAHPEQLVRINYRSDSTAFGTVSSASDTIEADWIHADHAEYEYDFSSINGSTATPNEQYAFDGWYNEAGELVSEDPVLDSDTVRSHLNSTTDSSYEGGVKYTETTFIAKFAELHTVTFVDDDGETVFSTAQYKTGTPASEIEQPTVPHKTVDGEEYEFAGWTPELVDVTEDAVYTATYKEVGKYVVTYHTNFGSGMDQTEEFEQTVGTVHQIKTYNSVFGAAPSGFTFIGWGLTSDARRPIRNTSVRAATDLYAIWDIGDYGARIYYEAEEGGTVTPAAEAISAEWHWIVVPIIGEYRYNRPSGPSSVTPDEGYEFDGWYTEDGTKITGMQALTPNMILANLNYSNARGFQNNKRYRDTTFIAKFKPVTYTVTYRIEGDSPEGYTVPTDSNKYKINDEVTVAEDGTTTVESKDGVPGSWTFKGWAAPEGVTVTDGKFSMPASDVEITGTWEFTPYVYTVTWLNDDGTELEKDTGVAYNATPSYDGATPVKAATAQYTYTFAGWTPEIVSVTGNATYTASYTAVTNQYTVTYTDGVDGTEVFADQVYTADYGTSTPAFSGTPSRAGYTFEGWRPSVDDTVTHNALYTAQWAEVEPTPTPVPAVVTDDDDDTTTTTPTVTPPAPVVPAAVIDDEPVPEAEPEEIPDEPAPAAAPEGVWALLNLLAAGLSTVGAAITLFRKKEEEDEDEDEAAKKPEEEDEKDNRGRNMAIAKVLGVAAAAASVITFILTEDMSLPMAMTDKWTLLMAVLFAGQIGTAVACKKASELDEEEDEEGTEA